MNIIKDIYKNKDYFISNNDYFEIIKKQGYFPIGNHSAVKTCLWLKKSIYNINECYKSKFYGIKSYRCIQMTPSIICNQKCIFCWRAIEIKPLKNITWNEPREIVELSIDAQLKLISGFGGSQYSNMDKYNDAKKPSNVAISLLGEPTLYPYLDELISIYKNKNITTFLVSNGTIPEMIEKINPNQLYISLDATNKKMYESICRPKKKEQWNKIIESLNILKEKNIKTAIRITVLKNYNYQHASEFLNLILLALPNYIEIKSYMHIGYSIYRLDRENMVTIEELFKFSNIICNNSCNLYKISNYSIDSRVVLLSLVKD